MKNGNNKTSSAGAKVTVACKVPLGVVIHVCTWNEVLVQTPSGSKMVRESQRGTEAVQILGPAYPNGQIPEGFRDKPLIVGGYALTPGIDKEFWDAWWADNADERCNHEDAKDGHKNGCKCTAIVRSRMIFAYEALGNVQAAAKEAKHLESGLEAIRPEGDYRSPRPLAGISQIKPATAPLPNG